MKIFFYALIIIITLGLTFKSENKYVPKDLSISKVLIVKRNFEDWQSTIKQEAKGFDNYAQNKMFQDYLETINGIEELFKERKVRYSIIAIRNNHDTDSCKYILDYNLNCNGGENYNSWWICLGGFYFTEIESSRSFEMIAPDLRAVKEIKKQLKQKK